MTHPPPKLNDHPPPKIRDPERPPPTPNIQKTKILTPQDTKKSSAIMGSSLTHPNELKARHSEKTDTFASLIGKSNDMNNFSTRSRGNEKDATTNVSPVIDIIRSQDSGRNKLGGAGTTNPASFVDTTTQFTKPVNLICNESSAYDAYQCIWPENVLDIVTSIAQSGSSKLKSSIFHFKISSEAANENWNTLNKFDNLGDALMADNKSFTRYGSEFRSTAILSALLHNHPLWRRLASILENGIQFPLDPLDFQTRSFDLTNRLVFGNHKGASTYPKFYDDLNKSDVLSGFSIPLPLSEIKNIPGLLICPMNVIEQMTISETGEIIEKRRACHDLSFTSPPSNTSVNSRVDTDQLQDCMFGHCIIRIIHYITVLRQRHPDTPILIQKIDFKSAYRRAHLHWETAIQCCSIYRDMVLVPLRAIFGGSPCPSEWSIISETTADIANMLLTNLQWQPESLLSPNQSLIPGPLFLAKDEKFAPALPLMVDIPTVPSSKCDVYIDDLITVCLGQRDNVSRASSAVPLAIHTIGRPVHPEEPIARDDLMCFRKLLAEGRLEEVKNILGWSINTRDMTIHIPTYKYKVWSDSIFIILKSRTVKNKQLETLIGRLNHISLIIPHILHFLGRLRRLQMSTAKRRKVYIKQVHVDDLNLMLKFLEKANDGINLNLITFRLPTHVYFSDACPVGLGGYNHNMIAWRFQIPTDLQNRASINILEHMASTIGPWLDMLSNDIAPLSCSLSLTDNTTAAGWLRKSNFADAEDTDAHMKVKMTIARDHASRILQHDIREYSQWFPGQDNIIADALSRDFHLSDNQLTHLITSHFPSQIRNHFKIVPLPPRIESWICALLRQMPVREQRQEVHRPSTIEHGNVGNSFLHPLICPMIHTWSLSQQPNESRFCQPSLTPSGQPSTLHPKFLDWVKTQSAIPSTMGRGPTSSPPESDPSLCLDYSC